MPGRDLLIGWLKDAHAMENALVPVLEDHAKQASAHPELEQRIRRHAQETERHRDLVEQCLERLGEDTSGGKDMMARISSAFQSKVAGMADDTLVKNALNDYATENFEIACYKALIKGAQQLGEDEIARTCEEILTDEKEMASFLDHHLDEVVMATV